MPVRSQYEMLCESEGKRFSGDSRKLEVPRNIECLLRIATEGEQSQPKLVIMLAEALCSSHFTTAFPGGWI